MEVHRDIVTIVPILIEDILIENLCGKFYFQATVSYYFLNIILSIIKYGGLEDQKITIVYPQKSDYFPI